MNLIVDPKKENKIKFLSNLMDYIVVFIALIPSFFYMYISIQEPWSNDHLVKSSLALRQGFVPEIKTQLAGYSAEHIASRLLGVSLIDSSHWPIDWLVLVPLGSLGIILLYYTIAKSVGAPKASIYALMIYAGWYYPRLGSQYAVHTYGWVHVLFLGFLLFFYFWLENRTIFYSLMIFILFVSTFFFYQTTPLWMITILIVGVIMQLIGEKNADQMWKSPWGIPVFMIVFYFYFDTVLYNNFLVRVLSEASEESLFNNFLSKVVFPLFNNKVEGLPYVFNPISPRLSVWATLISYLIMTIPVGIWITSKLYNAVSKKDLKILAEDNKNIINWSIIIAMFVHFVGYIGYGAVSLRLIPLAFPVILLLISKKKFLTNILMIALAAVSVLGFIFYAPTLIPDLTKEEFGNGSTLPSNDEDILSDPNLYTLMLMQAIQNQDFLQFSWVTPEIYSDITNNRFIESDYLVIDKFMKPIIASGWAFLDPWQNYINRIELNQNLNKIYESDNVIVFQNGVLDFPIYKDNFLSARADNGLLHGLFLWIRLTFSILFLIFPGFFVIIIMYENIKGMSGLYYFGLTFCLGITIFVLVGYIVNFIFKTLYLLNLIVIIISLVALLFTIKIVGQKKEKHYF